MPTPWAIDSTDRAAYGSFQVIFKAPGRPNADVTYFRDIPTEIESYTFGDPFGDATCMLRFPQISMYDDLGNGDLFWLTDFADVDIYVLKGPPANPTSSVKVWEGFLASYEFSSSGTEHTLSVQCQGALYQLDKYVQQPSFPQRPIPFELQIRDAFDPHKRPHLRTQPLQTVFPTNWTKVAKPSTGIYAPQGVRTGQKITGYAARTTGSWDRSLTSYIQNMLQVMLVDESEAQWTVNSYPGRQPVLYVRDPTAASKYTVWLGQPGVTMGVTRDMTQYANLIYGQGTDISGVEYKRQLISQDGTETAYDPMAFLPDVYPPNEENEALNREIMLVETYIKYDNGFDERQAIDSSRSTLRRDSNPGWSGTIKLEIDPIGGSRYEMRAGVPITVKYFAGTGEVGMKFHISEVTVNVMEGTVDLKVDTKFRDLLTLEESLARTRDPLTPSRMLQLNKRTNVIEDKEAPWDYSAGSGFIKTASTAFFNNIGNNDPYPYIKQAKLRPPSKYPQYYVRVNASSKDSRQRWTMGKAIPVILSAKGSIRRTEVVAFDVNGNIAKCRFHFAMYYAPVTVDNMPHNDQGEYSPFIPGAFESTDRFGQPVPASTSTGGGRSESSDTLPDKALVIGWGNYENPAGYSPGSRAAGGPVTGLLTDEVTWTYDMHKNPQFQENVRAGQTETPSSISYYGAFYAEFTQPVFFLARLYHQDSGT